MSAKHLPANSSRRKFVRSAGVLTLSGPGLLACSGPASGDRQLEFGSLDEAMQEAGRLAAKPDLITTSAWSLAQTLIHCAQSVEFSFSGFPEQKSALFRNTIGSAAFHVFDLRGRMSHDLAEPIPGAPALNPAVPVELAMNRLTGAVQDFRAAGDKLRPHFAYGDLSALQYERAHAMHLANHFSFMPG